MKGLLALDKIQEISEYLNSLIAEKAILNYKITLQLGMIIEVLILVDEIKGKKWYQQQQAFKDSSANIRISEIEFDIEEDDEYKQIFSKKIDLGIRRRLTNLINPNTTEIKKTCPIITFYSYKGGTGRTTSLVFFASWLATHYNKKVVILDCDFEAPGVCNYFDITSDKKGILEYFLDVEFLGVDNDINLKKDYLHQVRHEYVQKGDVFIMPAGNLSYEMIDNNPDRTYLSDYLEALSRLDITSINRIILQFESLFSELQKQLSLKYEDSLILIDSRTGFNDTFAVLSAFSDIIVGFFGINKQSQIGLTHLLNSYGTVNNNNKQIVLANSISDNINQYQIFKNIVNEYIVENEERFIDEQFGKKDFSHDIFRIPRTEFLGKIGTSLEDSDKGILKSLSNDEINIQFYTKIQRPDSEFEDFFACIKEKIDFSIELNSEIGNPLLKQIDFRDSSNIPLSNIDNSFFNSIYNKVNVIDERERILKIIIDNNNFPKPYADNDIPRLEDYFFRDCMKDLFIRDKFLIIGYKGTGKTHIYQSFKDKKIINVLCTRNRESVDNFIFVNVIPVFYQKKSDDDPNRDETNRYFDINTKFSSEEITSLGTDFFFERFWVAYFWNQIFSNEDILKLGVQTSLPTTVVTNDNQSANWFRKIINDNNKIELIESDIKKLDLLLSKKNINLTLSFDQLDFIVKPENWSEGISPLITYWRNNPFSKIYPKIFVRADIFENKLGNITNINELQEKSISLQWSKQELFAYFFKYIFKVAKHNLLGLSYAYNDYDEKAKRMLLDINNNLDNEQQISIHKENHLKFLVESFFGKYANRYNRRNDYGENYDWFYKNLTDAKGAISIRPFLDLINFAIKEALKPKNLKNEKENIHRSKQILSSFYFTSNYAKAYAAERYYNDLAKDKGNEPLRFFFQYIKNDGLEKFRVYEFNRELLDELLRRIIEFPNYKNEESLNNYSVDNFKNLLINNGILEVRHVTVKQYTRYIIPFLYRSYFGVGKPNRTKVK